MYNPMQPLINLATANFEAFTHFGKSSEFPQLSKGNTEKPGTFDLSSIMQAFNPKALTELTQTCMENYKRFAAECVQGATTVFEASRKSMSQQLEAVKAPMQTISNAATRHVRAEVEATERTAAAVVQASTEIAEKVTDNAVKLSKQTEQQDNEMAANTRHQTERKADKSDKADKATADTSKEVDEMAKRIGTHLHAAGH